MRIAAPILFAWASLLSSLFSTTAFAQTQAQRDDAKWILERITGVKWPTNSPIMQQAFTMAANGNRSGIANLATQQAQFLNVTVRNFSAKMSTREESIRTPMNDFIAGIMGVTRDNIDARELLYGNFFYVANANVVADTRAFAETILKSNRHYSDLDNKTAKIDIGASLVRINGQRLIAADMDGGENLPRIYTLVNNPDPAGILTSRTWIEAHAEAGTNRRPVEYTFREFMCLPIEKWADAAASDVRIGRDIDRFPGGDHLKFQTTCKACHTVMDGFRGAWAKWNFQDDTMIQSSVRRGNSDNNGVMNKMNQNAGVYGGGYVTTNDTWINNAMRGVNEVTFGFARTPASASGTGLNSFGRAVATSERFKTCMAKRVFEAVCRKNLEENEINVYQGLGKTFSDANFNLKTLFMAAALNPRCK